MPNSPLRSASGVRRILAATLLASTLAACEALEHAASRVTDRSGAFAALPVGPAGADRKAVLAAMGTPRQNVLGNVAGLEVELMTFEDCKSQYTVTLFKNRVWTKLSLPLSLTTPPTKKEN